MFSCGAFVAASRRLAAVCMLAFISQESLAMVKVWLASDTPPRAG
jgi:hypothetical protein